MSVSLLILLYKIVHQTEYRLVTIEADCLVGVEDGVVILEGIALLVLEEDAGHVARSERIVVAIGSQFATMQSLEVMLLRIDLLKE